VGFYHNDVMTGHQARPAGLAFAAPLARYAASPAYRALCRRVHRDDRPWFDLVDEVQRERLRDALRLGPEDRLLDLGCGAGALGSWLAAGRVVGIDLALAALARTGAPAVTGDLTRLPFPDGSFDAVAAVDSFYFLADPHLARAVAEALRSLRPGGRLVALVSELGEPGAPPACRLGQVLRARRLAVRLDDLTPREGVVWERKRAALDDLRVDFSREDAEDLWEALDEETRRGLELIGAGRVRRWLVAATVRSR
jgi:SAM-dependent methyltransferase